MSRLETYAKYAPFSIDELIEAANSVLRAKPQLQLSKRTARYYITEGIIPPPTGAPKYARYSFESLLRIVGARTLLDQGISLEKSKLILDNLIVRSPVEAIRQIERWIGEDRIEVVEVAAHSAPMLAESTMAALRVSAQAPVPVRDEALFRRIELRPGLVLEADASMEEGEALSLAKKAIERRLGRS